MAEGFHLISLRISCLLFVEDVFLLASSSGGLQLALEWFTVECEVVAIRTSKSEAMVPSQKKVVLTPGPCGGV